LPRTFYPTLTTTALYRSSSGWFETCSLKPIPRGLPSSPMQLYNTDFTSSSTPSVLLQHTSFHRICPKQFRRAELQVSNALPKAPKRPRPDSFHLCESWRAGSPLKPQSSYYCHQSIAAVTSPTKILFKSLPGRSSNS